MLTDAFLDVFIQSWQFRRGVVSFAEVVSSGHHVQYLHWYRFHVESEEIKGVVHPFNNSSSGWDGIPTFLVKKCVDSFIEPLTYLVNSSISESIFPSELKLARVVPIFKSGDPSLITNYRPISVLSFFSKVFEKVLYILL